MIAPWLVPLLLGADDRDAVTRERALGLNDRVVARCDGVVLAGGRISPGMEREIAAIEAAGGWVADLTSLGDEPPGSDVRFITSLLTRVIDSPLAWGQRQWAARRAV